MLFRDHRPVSAGDPLLVAKPSDGSKRDSQSEHFLKDYLSPDLKQRHFPIDSVHWYFWYICLPKVCLMKHEATIISTFSMRLVDELTDPNEDRVDAKYS